MRWATLSGRGNDADRACPTLPEWESSTTAHAKHSNPLRLFPSERRHISRYQMFHVQPRNPPDTAQGHHTFHKQLDQCLPQLQHRGHDRLSFSSCGLLYELCVTYASFRQGHCTCRSPPNIQCKLILIQSQFHEQCHRTLGSRSELEDETRQWTDTPALYILTTFHTRVEFARSRWAARVPQKARQCLHQ